MISKNFNKIINSIRYFYKNESAGGIILLICAVMAIVAANSILAPSYNNFLHTYVTIGFKNFSLTMSVLHWINDGLMAIFFFVVGMEIKRELIVGELNSIKKTILPVAAAIGGMIVPAIVYSIFNYSEVTISAWAIPMATDIAFALGILSLVGTKRAPTGIIVFLTALAIVDDLGAIVVIAIFYTNQISWTALFIALIILIVLILMNKFKVKYASLFILLGIILWIVLLKSGIHSTIAGVMLAMTIPVEKGIQGYKNSMLYRLEHSLSHWASFIIMPIFALSNAGVAIELGNFSEILNTPVSLGILFGLFMGKQIGIFGTSYLLIRLKIATLPSQVTFRHLYGASLLGGIGFTMSLFVTSLSFNEGSLMSLAKISILCASLLSATAGVLVFRSVKINN